MADARRYPRYAAKRGVLAILTLHGEIKASVGELVDLSEGGLAFEHTGDDEPYTGPAEVEIFGFEPPQHSIGKIPCRVVYERGVKTFPGTTTETRRCGIQFDASVRETVEKLRAFIAANAGSD